MLALLGDNFGFVEAVLRLKAFSLCIILKLVKAKQYTRCRLGDTMATRLMLNAHSP